MKCSLVTLTLLILSAFAAGCSNNVAEDDPHSGPVMNYHRIGDRLLTGGHLLDDGPATLAAEGVKVVIDLRDESPDGEKQRYAKHGIKWNNVPIVWDSPQASDFDEFREVMAANTDAHVMVQCAANYRASAMTYLYRVIVDEVPEAKARKEMDAVWNPDEYEIWRHYIDGILASHAK